MHMHDSSLWKRTLGDEGEADPYRKPRERLRNALDQMREKVIDLVRSIPEDCKGLTVHDERHLDALWDMADLILGPDYIFTPVEAFVFGASVLLHDAGLTASAYTGGVAEIKNTAEWSDAAETLAPEHKPGNALDPDVERQILFGTLRRLHARKAEELITQTWDHPSTGAKLSLLEDAELLDYYGASIGKIAHSHHWEPTRLITEFRTKIGAHTAFPSEWTLDEALVAFALRCADAAQIDHRRAPTMLFALAQPVGHSRQHWNFQAKLAKPTISTGVLRYTSNRDFKIDEADDWWLCFDTLGMINSELTSAERLLEDSERQPFSAKRVFGSGNPEQLAKLIRPRGWRPVDAKIQVSNPAHLAETIGGRNLYGNKPYAAIREIIQNAADAVRLRRAIQDRDNSWGRVVLKIESIVGQGGTETWLHIDDQGIGLNEAELTNTLLDFGKSSWASDAIRDEFPGAIRKFGKPIGKFGIGFFSIFLLGQQVRVISHRFNKGPQDANALEFSSLNSRPLIRKCEASELPLDYNTRVSVRLANSDDLVETDDFSPVRIPTPEGRVRLLQSIARLVVGLDINVEIRDTTIGFHHHHQHTWLDQDPTAFIGELLTPALPPGRAKDEFIAAHAPLMRTIIDDSGKTWGRAAVIAISDKARPVRRTTSYFGISVGGFTYPALQSKPIVGLIKGDTNRAARTYGFEQLPAGLLAKWATEQAALLDVTRYSKQDIMWAARNIQSLGGNSAKLPYAYMGGHYADWDTICTVVKETGRMHVLLHKRYDEALDTRAVGDLTSNFFFEKVCSNLFVSDFDSHKVADGEESRRALAANGAIITNEALAKDSEYVRVATQLWGTSFTAKIEVKQIHEDTHYYSPPKHWVLTLERSS